MSSVTTYYTNLGYCIELEIDGCMQEVARGGNHPMCSESRLAPYELGQPAGILRALSLVQVAAHARVAHGEALQAHSDALDCGVIFDADGQDEEMAMLGRPDQMRKIPRLQYRLAALRSYQRTWPRPEHPEMIAKAEEALARACASASAQTARKRANIKGRRMR